MAKAKSVEGATLAIEEVVEKGAESVRSGMEKAAKGFEKLQGFHKETLEALIASAGVAGKGAEKVQTELSTYAKSAGEAYSDALKAVFGAKSLQAAFEAHSDYAKGAFESYVAEMTKLNDMVMETTRSAIEPMQIRAKAFAGMFEMKMN